MKLLTRDIFRTNVFNRDNHKCVVPWCNNDAVDAHHIIERKLWDDEGYYMCNGASLCGIHHKMAEKNQIMPQSLWEYIGAKNYIVPNNFEKKLDYTKWGKLLPNPNRIRPKYPTTFYLPNSPIPPEHTKDKGDGRLSKVDGVITIKMDGSNVKLTSDFVAARNGSSAEHKSFDLLKALHVNFKELIPKNIDVFGEWLYAKHSIHYDGLDSYLQIFGVYNIDTHMFGSWDDVISMSKKLELNTVPVIKFTSPQDNEYVFLNKIKKIGEEVISKGHEGIVVRNRFGYHFSQHSENVMKFVRENHVQTDKHWSSGKIIRNLLNK